MVELTWIKCQGDVWCALERVDLSKISTTGVYMIWHSGDPAQVVRVGQGDIADRLAAHRDDPKILHYNKFGELFVTWASARAEQLDGIERYLAETWSPLVGDVFPDVEPIAVNSPFA